MGEILFNQTNNVTSLNNTTDSMGYPERTKDEENARKIMLFFGTPVLILGSIGNIMSFAILRNGDLNKLSTCFYMSVLAIIDTGKFKLYH